MSPRLAFLVLTALPAFGACSYSLAPTSANFPATGGNDIVQISGSAGCTWTAVSNVPWITLSFGLSGTGDGTTGYTVQANPFTVSRTGTMTIAGLTFTVTQPGGGCTYTLSPTSANLPASAGSGTFSISVNSNSCPWTVSSANSDWLTVTSASTGAGPSTVRYSYLANTSTVSRTGSITLGTQSFTVTQSGQCGFTLNPVTNTLTAAGGTGSFTVTPSSTTCSWTAISNNADWLVVTSGSPGTGNGTVNYTAQPNTTGQQRSGTISVGNSGFTVVQSGSCSFTLSTGGLFFAAGGGSATFNVTTSCQWTPQTSASWINVTAPTGPTLGNATVNFTVSANDTAQSRTGSINVGTQNFVISQAGVTCAITLSVSTGAAPAAGTAGSISVGAVPGCAWSAVSGSPWLVLTSNSGTGNGEVLYTVQPNTTASARTAVVTISNSKFTVIQDGAQCDLQISPAAANFPLSGGSGSIAVTTVCGWTASTTAGWITLAAGSASGTGNGAVNYTVAKYSGAVSRSGIIQIGPAAFTVNQNPSACTLTLNPATASLPGSGGSGVIQVSASGPCSWTPSANDGWLSVDTWLSVDGSGTVNYHAGPNNSGAARNGSLTIGSQTFSLQQSQLVVKTSAAGVVNAASSQGGAVAPGEIVTLYGSGLGPVSPASLQLTPDGQLVTNSLASVQVLFDGVPAPLIYVSDSQVSAVVPYDVAGQTSTSVQVSNGGITSDPLALSVAASAPALFTQTASGAGPAAALNQDYSLNTAANPAARGSVLQLFATGEGQTSPGGINGKLAAAPLPKPVQPVKVQIGGVDAPVLYAGAAPGLVAGLMQVNVQVPRSVSPGAAVSVMITVGAAASPAGVTVAVK